MKEKEQKIAVNRMPKGFTPKCDFKGCVAGLGLASYDYCWLDGEWDNPNCPKFEKGSEPSCLSCGKKCITNNQGFCEECEEIMGGLQRAKEEEYEGPEDGEEDGEEGE